LVNIQYPNVRNYLCLQYYSLLVKKTNNGEDWGEDQQRQRHKNGEDWSDDQQRRRKSFSLNTCALAFRNKSQAVRYFSAAFINFSMERFFRIASVSSNFL